MYVHKLVLDISMKIKVKMKTRTYSKNIHFVKRNNNSTSIFIAISNHSIPYLFSGYNNLMLLDISCNLIYYM